MEPATGVKSTTLPESLMDASEDAPFLNAVPVPSSRRLRIVALASAGLAAAVATVVIASGKSPSTVLSGVNEKKGVELWSDGLASAGDNPSHVADVDPNTIENSILEEETWHSMGKFVAVDEGKEVGTLTAKQPGDCELACDGYSMCKSFVVCENKCYLKDKKLTGREERKYNGYCGSHFKSRDKYWPVDLSLIFPSAPEPLSFYVYRTVQDNKGERLLENVNTASIEGALWYLHNEVIPVCDGTGTNVKADRKGTPGERKFGINRMYRYKISYKPTTALLRTGNRWGVLKSFDYGENTGPHRGFTEYGPGTGPLSGNEWMQYGYPIGCGIVGEYPHQSWAHLAGYGKKAVWYSFTGSCSEVEYTKNDQKCIDASPGGWCESATGQGNCTYSYDDAGFIDLDELVGIKPKWESRAAFCAECQKEGDIKEGGGCGLSFWNGGIWDKVGNAARAQAVDKMFADKYHTMATDSHIPPPACDFDWQTYGMARDDV